MTALLYVSLVDRRPRLAVYACPHGWLGRAYLALIEPFRRYVYPSLLRRASASVTALASAGSTGLAR